MKTTTIVAIILGVLVLISVVQAFQLNGLKEKVTEGQLSVKSTSASSVPVAAGNKKTESLPSSIKDLPQMVGGC